MGDTDFFGRVGELESLQDAYDRRTAEMAIIYGHRRIGKTALIQKFCEGKPTFFYTAKEMIDQGCTVDSLELPLKIPTAGPLEPFNLERGRATGKGKVTKSF